ncbi:chromatin assembly factor 1 subunit A [Suncus etruscus]|uniref:chromatin assembly factor 1 subunit A n=1 Tax=Suncus etruscus TaxID=109475 RepID=UPI002110210D|nr:chromatin assembly factor 1 subunit A [Suncus etruscus]
MDCKDRPVFPVKKLIQARLPFKRLNLIPKEKPEDGAPAAAPLGASLDSSEHECALPAEQDFGPKLVNGKGPLDSFLCSKARSSLGPATVVIDLTEDSTDQADLVAPKKLSNDTLSSEEGVSGVQDPGEPDNGDPQPLPPDSEESGSTSPEESLLDSSCSTEDEAGAASPQRGFRPACQDLIPGLSIYPLEEQDCWRRTGLILCKDGKVPVVVLRDLRVSKLLPLACSLLHPPSESEASPESGPEDVSSLSSSPTSSPEVLATSWKGHSDAQCLQASMPIPRKPKKLVRDSAEKLKRRLQREKDRLGKQLRLQAEKQAKERLREEAKQAKEAARRKREEEKEMKEKERRERRAQGERERAEKQRQREERRKEKQEALEAKQEEKRKKEEERRLREEEKRIKAEKAEITRFFQKPKTPSAPPKTLAGFCGKFAPFEIKEHMVLAPLCRVAFDQDLSDRLDGLLQQQCSDTTFLDELQGRRPLSSGPTMSPSRSTDLDLSNSDVVIVESGKVDGVPERRRFGRMKLLQFSENHRPAYWGTWNKTTAVIRPRQPWAQDTKLLDYEVDSDEEWEEEEPGESLSHSEGDEDDEVGDDEDEDDGFFVPHGYLSEDEGVTEECADPENHRVRQKLKAQEWDEFLAKDKRFRVLQPTKVGCLWEADRASGASEQDFKVLQQFRICLLETAPPEDEQTPKNSKRHQRDRQILGQLLPLLHGNVNGSKVIIREFQECCRRGLLDRDTGSPESSSASPTSPGSSRPQTPTATPDDSAVPSKARLKRLISENSVYEKRPDFRMCWYVHPHVLRSFDQEQLPVPCQWSYVTTVPSATRDEGSVPVTGASQGTLVSLKRKSAGSMCITQFMKKRRHEGQVGAGDLDGFQADTEEEEDDDGDCVIMDISEAGADAQHLCGPVPAAGRPGGGGSSEAAGSLLGSC